MNPSHPGDHDNARTVYLRLSGRSSLRAGDGTSRNLSRKDAALLALLALDGAQAREVLAGRLWPDVAERQAALSLRQRISRLRRDTGHRVIDTGSSLTLAEGVVVDVHGIGSMTSAQLLECGDLLAGHDYGDDEWLDEWVQARREHSRRDRADALAGWTARLEQQGDLAAALMLGEHVLALAPRLEHAWRRQMRLHYLRGDRSAAIETFRRFEAFLSERSTTPDAETLKLLQTIQRAQHERPAARPLLPPSLMRPPQLIGREVEWATMARAWAAGRAFVLSGDAGMGKTRLLTDFLRERSGVVFDQGRPGDAQTPYALLARLLDTVVARHAQPPDEFTRHELARILPRLGPAPLAAGQQATLWRAVEKLLEAARAAGLTALAVDDLHFGDLASLEALRWLSASQGLSGMHLGFASRPVDGSDIGKLQRAWIDDSHRPEQIELRVLSASEVDALLQSLDLPELASPGLGERLFRHAGGQPLFTLETLRVAVLEDQVPASDELPKPSRVQTLLDRRLADLPPRALDLLRVAAVAGVDLTVERAARLLACTAVQLAEPWSDLEAANVLQGLRFAHELVRDSALRLLPGAVRHALHAAMAQMLADDNGVAPARVAEHWQSAEHWPEAAASWYRAGMAARYAGRLVEQQTLLEQAAECHRRAGNPGGEFDALHASLDGVLIRHGGASVLAALSRIEALADTPERRLRLLLTRAEALVDLEHHDLAVEVAEHAVQLAATSEPALLGDALALQGVALAQGGRLDEAIASEHRAADVARSKGSPEQALRAVRSLAYVLYAAGRIGESVRFQREAMHLAGVLGDQAEAVAAEGNLAALLGVVGDVPAAYEHAVRARRHYEQMGSSTNSSLGGMNLVALGTAAAYLGRFDEALAALLTAVQLLGEDALLGLRAKARISLAGLWLTLGRSDAARALVAEFVPEAPPAMQMQQHLILARADEMDDRPGTAHWQRLADLMAQHPALPLVQSAWIEWSYQGEPQTVIAQLRRVRAECDALGLPGTARTLLLREIDRLGEIDTAAAIEQAAAEATRLQPFVAEGTSAKTYPPEGWLILARAFERAGKADAAGACRRSAVAWIHERALPHVPPEYRRGFLERNPINRWLLDPTGLTMGLEPVRLT